MLLGITLTVARDKELGIWARFSRWKEQPWKIEYAKYTPYFLDGVHEIFLKGNGFITTWKDVVAMLIMGLSTFFIDLGGTSLHRYWDKKESAEKEAFVNTNAM